MKNFLYLIVCVSVLSIGTTAFAGSIERASDIQISRIIPALTGVYVTYGMIDALCIKSDEHANMYYVGIKFENNDIGIWALNGKYKEHGLLFSVNSLAHKASGMGYACRTKARICESDPPVKKLINQLQ